MKKNVAGQSIGVEAVTAADGTAFTGTITVYITGDSGTQAIGSVGAGVCTHEGNGYHSYLPAQAETNYNHIAFTFIGTGAIPVTNQVYTTFPQSVDNATGIAANNTLLLDIPTVAEFEARTLVAASYFDPAVDAVATVTTLTNLPSIPANWLTATGIAAGALNGKGDWNIGKTGYSLTQAFPTNFADMAITVTTGQVTAGNMRGTDDALLAASYTAPDNAGIAANGVAIAAVPTFVQMTAAFTEIKGATWATTDTLEAIRDRGDAAWITATTTISSNMRGTDSAALASVCTEARLAELDAANLPADIAAVPTAAENTTAILTTQMTESYAADGVAPTLAQAMFLTQQSINEFGIVGTTRSVRKLDGISIAATFTLNSSTNPSDTTRTT